ncbi:aldo/keto reductase [Pelagibacteraceae bacterium]|nr:aldo/keto reductase [Pelagibacteraceae bacterium]
MKSLKKKLVLGSANIARTYGINNSNLAKNSSLEDIFILLKRKKIFFIDTAHAYENSERNLSEFNLKKFNIISKLPIMYRDKNKKKIESQIINYVNKSLKKLKIKSFYALLIHNTKDLRGKQGEKIFKTLRLLKKQNIVKKIGYSIYNPKELDKHFIKFKPDLIQGPLNLFDQRIINSGWIDRLNKNGVEFHARSIFLQGLLLKKFKNIPKKFKKYNNIFKKYHSWLKKNGINSLEACLLFISSIKLLSKIVVGVDNVKQLNEIINFKIIKKKINFKEMNCIKTNLINPTSWQI